MGSFHRVFEDYVADYTTTMGRLWIMKQCTWNF